uniref:Protein-tyrosine-phosphatase n=1 Tax=Soboliphyme baturini TaxID=241478 RepID=A0A183J6H4_9BILA
LQKLLPYSLYEVTIAPRNSLSVPSSFEINTPKVVKEIRTGEKVPDGPPVHVSAHEISETSASVSWESPQCDVRNGEITQYEYKFVGSDPWVEHDLRQATTARTRTLLHDLAPGSRYQFQVRAFTSLGHGPWSPPLEIRTSGSETGMPREVHPVSIGARQITFSWLPPYPVKSPIGHYRLKYSKANENMREVSVDIDDLSCANMKSSLISAESLCYTLKNLDPQSTYRLEVAAVSPDGRTGRWAPTVYASTKESRAEGSPLGFLKLLQADEDSLRVHWAVPEDVQEEVSHYSVEIAPETFGGMVAPLERKNISHDQTTHHFKKLEPDTNYNVTVRGASSGRWIWSMSKVFRTKGKGESILYWLPAPSNLELIERSDKMLHVAWDPSEILLSSLADDVTNYRVGPYSKMSSVTDSGYGEMLWNVFSTLPYPGAPDILRLKHRTPTTLNITWTPVWETSILGYQIHSYPLWPAHVPTHPIPVITDVEPGKIEATITGLQPATIYNVTLVPKDRTQGIYGLFATLPLGSFVPRDLKVCDESAHAISLSFAPIDYASASHYQVW